MTRLYFEQEAALLEHSNFDPFKVIDSPNLLRSFRKMWPVDGSNWIVMFFQIN